MRLKLSHCKRQWSSTGADECVMRMTRGFWRRPNWWIMVANHPSAISNWPDFLFQWHDWADDGQLLLMRKKFTGRSWKNSRVSFSYPSRNLKVPVLQQNKRNKGLNRSRGLEHNEYTLQTLHKQSHLIYYVRFNFMLQKECKYKCLGGIRIGVIPDEREGDAVVWEDIMMNVGVKG